MIPGVVAAIWLPVVIVGALLVASAIRIRDTWDAWCSEYRVEVRAEDGAR